jgi:hypothetical protein
MEILVNTNSPITHKVFWQGELVDADTIPVVKVYDITEDPAVSPAINPGSILSTISTSKSEVNVGTYSLYLPLNITNRRRQLRLIWEYTVYGNAVSKEHKIFVQVPYVDIPQAIDALDIGIDPSDPNYRTYSELLEAEKWARKVIENYTGQQFYLYDDLQTVYGSGSDVLPLPYRLSELHELYSKDILLIDTINNINNTSYSIQVSESGFGVRVNRANMLDNTVYVANGMVPPSIHDNVNGVFGRGVPYKVQGRYGWEEVPDEVELACIELMRDYFSKDRNWRNKYLDSIQTFDWNFKYNNESFRGTGNVYADQILLPYVLTQMVVI